MASSSETSNNESLNWQDIPLPVDISETPLRLKSKRKRVPSASTPNTPERERRARVHEADENRPIRGVGGLMVEDRLRAENAGLKEKVEGFEHRELAEYNRVFEQYFCQAQPMVHTKFHSFKNYFACLVEKSKGASGAAGGTDVVVKWVHYKRLLFLKDSAVVGHC